MEYTEAEHAKGLRMMLETEEPCKDSNCPLRMLEKREGFVSNRGCYRSSVFNEICLTFVDLDRAKSTDCPCYQLEPKEAIKRTRVSLEAKGYID